MAPKKTASLSLVIPALILGLSVVALYKVSSMNDILASLQNSQTDTAMTASVTDPGCTNGSVYSSTTGALCPVAPTPKFYFGGMTGRHFVNGVGQDYINPITGSSTCPTGYTKTQVLGSAGIDSNLYYCVGYSTNTTKVADFGGLIGYNSATTFNPNPITGQSTSTCPMGYSKSQVYGSTGLDNPIFLCYKLNTTDYPTDTGFRGMYGTFTTATTTGKYSNPVAGGPTCWGGETDAIVYGTPSTATPRDNQIDVCVAPTPTQSLTTVSPALAHAGDTVTLTGTGFNSNSIIKFFRYGSSDAKAVTVTATTPTTISSDGTQLTFALDTTLLSALNADIAIAGSGWTTIRVANFGISPATDYNNPSNGYNKNYVYWQVATSSVAYDLNQACLSSTIPYTFTINLTLGSAGNDVVVLQNLLRSKGLLFIPTSGYFGPETQAGVAAYQVSKGITPADGYFGPIVRAAANADCAANFKLLSTKLSAIPADNSNIRVQSDVPVYGIDFTSGSVDMSVQTLDLQTSVINASTGASENPAVLINTVKVWDGVNTLTTIPISTSSFTKDQGGHYFIRLSGLNLSLPKNSTKTMVVSFSTNAIDNDRVVLLQGYQQSSVRAVSTYNGVSSFYDLSTVNYLRTHTFKKVGPSILTLLPSSYLLHSQNYVSNAVDTLQGVPINTFNLNSQSSESGLVSIDALVYASGTLPTTLYLYQNSNLLKSKTVTASSTTVGHVLFDNLDTTAGGVILRDTPITYIIKADFPSNVKNGSYARADVSTIYYRSFISSIPQSTIQIIGTGVTGVNQYIYNKAALISTLASMVLTPVIDQNGHTSSLTATFPLTMQARGGNVVLPKISDFDIRFSSAANEYSNVSKSVSVIPNNNISDGSVSAVNVTASVGNSTLPATGNYSAYIKSITWDAGNGPVIQTYGLEDFRTPLHVFIK